jgi:hypothetical protein
MQAKVIDDKVVAKERKKEFEISRINRFRYRTRYFTDSGIIGSKEFVAENYQRFKHLFCLKREKKTKADQRFGWDEFIKEIGGELIFFKELKKSRISQSYVNFRFLSSF